jgi:HlyD family secretion protein
MSDMVLIPAGADAPRAANTLARGMRRRVYVGLFFTALVFGGGGVWMAYAPLNGAAMAPGVISADSRNKTMQHLEGGIIRQILVEEGSKVETGQILVRLDDTRAVTDLQSVLGQLWAALGLQARLVAERDNLQNVDYPAELRTHQDDPEVAKIIKAQTGLFEARRTALTGQAAILTQKIGQYEEEIGGLNAQVQALDRQLGLIREESATVKQLVDQGLEKKPRLLALMRSASELEGQRGQAVAQIARARQNIGEMKLQITQLSIDRQNEVADSLNEVQSQIADLREQQEAAQDKVDRLAIRAPQPGTVVRLQFHTVGGVVGPGQPILDFVPRDDKLVVEARVRPEDVGVVRVGMPAEVRIHAYNQRRLPLVLGKVTYISADRISEKAEKNEEPYYLARVEIDPDSIERLPDAKLYAGMTTEVLIETGERTALDYFLTPITTSLRRSFREQ